MLLTIFIRYWIWIRHGLGVKAPTTAKVIKYGDCSLIFFKILKLVSFCLLWSRFWYHILLQLVIYISFFPRNVNLLKTIKQRKLNQTFYLNLYLHFNKTDVYLESVIFIRAIIYIYNNVQWLYIVLQANAPAHATESGTSGCRHRPNQTGDIPTLNGSSLKLVDKFTNLGSSVSST